MNASLRVRLLVSMLATMALAALLFAGVTYRNVLRETERLFDYQLAQMAMSLRDAGVLPDDAGKFFARLAASEKQMVVLAGSDHAAHVVGTHVAWIAAIVNFLNRPGGKR